MTTGFLIFLFWPASVDIRWIGLPRVATLAILTRLQWGVLQETLVAERMSHIS